MLLGRRFRNSVQTVAVSLNRMRRLQVRFGLLLRELCWFIDMVCDAAIPEGRNSDAVCRSVTFDKPVFVPAKATKSGNLVLLAANVTAQQIEREILI